MTTNVPAEFIDLLTAHQARLQSYISSLLANHEATWDVLQETNRVLIEKHKDFMPGSSFVNWSLTVAQYQVMACLRDRNRDRHILSPDLAEVLTQDEGFVSWKSRDQRFDALESCMKTLSPKNRDLVRCRYGQGETLVEISDRTARTVNSLKQAFFRIRQSLSECIEQRIETR